MRCPILRCEHVDATASFAATGSRAPDAYPRTVGRYELLVDLCRRLGVVTPEDEYPIWETDEESFVVAPLFLLYDYSFRDPDTSLADAMEYAY